MRLCRRCWTGTRPSSTRCTVRVGAPPSVGSAHSLLPLPATRLTPATPFARALHTSTTARLATSALQPSLKDHGTWSPEAWRALQDVYANSRLLANSCRSQRTALSAQHLAADAPTTPASGQAAVPGAPGAAPLATGGGGILAPPAASSNPPAAAAADARRGAVRALFAPGERVRVQGLLGGPPDWFRPPAWLGSLEGVQFYSEALVEDADDDLALSNPQAARQGSVTIRFDLARPWQCICFHLGYGAQDSSPLLSYSMPVAFYRLPHNGELWCQHINFLDADDVVQVATRRGLPFKHLSETMHPQELLAAVVRCCLAPPGISCPRVLTTCPPACVLSPGLQAHAPR
jgi:hypothetical protein